MRGDGRRGRAQDGRQSDIAEVAEEARLGFNRMIRDTRETTQLISALVALVTGTNFGVGQMLPAGYDVYNVPYQYRDRYYDDDRYMYRYADGHIYQVDPTTRLISAVIDAIV